MSSQAPDAFAAVLGRGRGATAVPAGGNRPRLSVGTSVFTCDFIECSGAVIDCVLDAELPTSREMLKAYLLFHAWETPTEDDWETHLGRFYGNVSQEVWNILGFASGAPSRFDVDLAFGACREFRYSSSELQALIIAVEFFAGADLFNRFKS